MPNGADFMTLTLYSRPGCHLCDDMKAVVQRVKQSSPQPISVEEIDISTDPELEARYGVEIPVLLVNGTRAAKFRVTEDELKRILAGRIDESDTAGRTRVAGRTG
jgi:thiol-disulfide isomerase/thioredoxin